MTECKICYDPQYDDELIHPCKCNSYVHRSCLHTWIKLSKDPLSLTRCEVCHISYKYQLNDNIVQVRKRAKFLLHRDIGLVVLWLIITFFLSSLYTFASYYGDIEYLIITKICYNIINFTFLLLFSIIAYIVSFYIYKYFCIWHGMNKWKGAHPYLFYIMNYKTNRESQNDFQIYYSRPVTNNHFYFFEHNINCNRSGNSSNTNNKSNDIVGLIFFAIVCLVLVTISIVMLVKKIIQVHELNLIKNELLIDDKYIIQNYNDTNN